VLKGSAGLRMTLCVLTGRIHAQPRKQRGNPGINCPSGTFIATAQNGLVESKETTMKKHLAVAASVLALAAAPALAESHGEAEHEFPLTMAEFMAAYPDVTPEEFAEIDADGDGQISEEEYNEARDAGLIDDNNDDNDDDDA
jgi:hypothetical protein